METYECIALCTSHIAEVDCEYLSKVAKESQMIFERDTGFFIKLYEHLDDSTLGMPGSVVHIMKFAHCKGFRMIELDADVVPIGALPEYKWRD